MFDEEHNNQDHHRHDHFDRLHKRNWMRHTAMVPKGFIRFHVLSALNEKPMSGSELMESIEKHAGGFWKPSPGSIYPLLSWLQDEGYVKELPTENGLKRYELTSSGKTLLQEQKGIMEKFRENMGFSQPPFGAFFMKVPPEKAAVIRGTLGNAGKAMFRLGSALQKNYSDEALSEAIKAINEAASKLKEIARKLEGEPKK